ncbi:cation-dependent mannose-6-phosphate receptor [Brienomyrus brachyistius]|uniref:cation-dependent mannose-6-phosphate receptor n=1 Tax=Brienomyrus brachyistius TaxID=42636 RepID=UPI0020B24260|nr:cation-dependent mannose-6-phosphate receptor [Brienomyrus brachyistius]
MYIFHKMPVLSLVVLLVLVIEDGEAGNNTSNCKLDSVSKNSQAEKEALGRLEPLTNRNFTVNTGGDEAYTYQFRVCGDAGEIPEGGVVQRDKEGKETVVGRYNVTEAIGGSDWVMLIYKNGSSYDRHCSSEGRKAIIMISCKPGVLAGDLAIILEERQREKNCFYLFELDSSAVCPPVSSKLSLGSILLIIGFTCLAVYLIGGFLYQRLVVGAKGMEQFPNYSFWQEIGNLTADGCDFVCRSRGSREEPPTCQGVATEPLGEESEERDDQLLPM